MVLEELTKGEIPKHWSQKFEVKCKKLEQNGQEDKMALLKQEASIIYMKKLNKLVEYIKKTNLVESEETRSMILSELERTRNQWRENKTHEV